MNDNKTVQINGPLVASLSATYAGFLARKIY